jgi:hypothetical protein
MTMKSIQMLCHCPNSNPDFQLMASQAWCKVRGTMLGDLNTLYRQSKVVHGLEPHHGYIIFVGAKDNLIAWYMPLVLRETYLFLMGLPQYLLDLGTLSTWRHVGRHADFSFIQYSLVTSPLCKVYLDHL